MANSRIDLSTLGWDAAWERQFAAAAQPQWTPARVAEEDKHGFRVVTPGGEVRARISGRLRHDNRTPADLPKVGDWVALVRLPGEEKAVIHRILPRRTRVARKTAGREMSEQVLATNMDVAFVVQALDSTFHPRRLERFLVMVHEGGARPVVILNKADLCADPTPCLAEAQKAAGAVPVVITCARTGRGMKELANHLGSGQTAVFIGTSGVGKSSLINRLYGEEVQPTLEVRERDAKGRHATTWRELILLPSGGLVIDTPGMREFHMGLAQDAMGDAFPDLATLGQDCRFRDCTHTVEAGCAVRVAVADGRLDSSRHQNYLKLRLELDYLAEENRIHTYRVNRRRAGRPSPPLPDDPEEAD